MTSSQLPGPILRTIVYAKCNNRDRKALWEGMRRIETSDTPWSIGGDFNIITSADEKEGGARPDINGMNDFNACIMDCGLNDIGFDGIPFTWQ